MSIGWKHTVKVVVWMQDTANYGLVPEGLYRMKQSYFLVPSSLACLLLVLQPDILPAPPPPNAIAALWVLSANSFPGCPPPPSACRFLFTSSYTARQQSITCLKSGLKKAYLASSSKWQVPFCDISSVPELFFHHPYPLLYSCPVSHPATHVPTHYASDFWDEFKKEIFRAVMIWKRQRILLAENYNVGAQTWRLKFGEYRTGLFPGKHGLP